MNYQYWFGTTQANYGYGAMLEGFKSGLPAGVEMHDRASVAVMMYDPSRSHGFLKGQYRALYSMWETTELPYTYYRNLKAYDKIIVPCEHNRELFSKYHDDVVTVPLGVDLNYWKPVVRPENSRMRFHAGGSTWLRKGLDVVVEAFKQSGIDAELYIKVPLKRFVPDTNWTSNVVIHTGFMSKKEQMGWYSKADCFVAASRGEGFGLMPLQAMAMGIPTIITATSGQAQYADLASITIPTTPQKSDVHEIVDFAGYWDEPDLDALVSAFRAMSVNHTIYKARAMAQVWEVSRYGWDVSCQKLLNELPVGSVLDEAVYEPFVGYQEIRVNRKCEAGINLDHWDFVPGVDYTVTNTVYDILARANYIQSHRTVERSDNHAKGR